MKQRAILIISVIIGLIAAVLTRQYLNAKDREVARRLALIERSQQKIPVIAVRKNLAAGTVLQKDDLGVKDAIESSVRGHAVKQQDYMLILGRRTARPLEAGAPVFWSDIEGGEPGRGGLAADIKPRMRALSINVSGAASVSGMVRPNDRVDVLGTFSFPSRTRPGEMELVTLTILQDVIVLAAGRETAKSLYDDRNAGSGSYSTVTLEVTPREAEMLVFAEQVKGRLALTLRNASDVYYEKETPRVDFEKIEAEITTLNRFRQEKLLQKRTD